MTTNGSTKRFALSDDAAQHLAATYIPAGEVPMFDHLERAVEVLRESERFTGPRIELHYVLGDVSTFLAVLHPMPHGPAIYAGPWGVYDFQEDAENEDLHRLNVEQVYEAVGQLVAELNETLDEHDTYLAARVEDDYLRAVEDDVLRGHARAAGEAHVEEREDATVVECDALISLLAMVDGARKGGVPLPASVASAAEQLGLTDEVFEFAEASVVGSTHALQPYDIAEAVAVVLSAGCATQAINSEDVLMVHEGGGVDSVFRIGVPVRFRRTVTTVMSSPLPTHLLYATTESSTVARLLHGAELSLAWLATATDAHREYVARHVLAATVGRFWAGAMGQEGSAAA